MRWFSQISLLPTLHDCWLFCRHPSRDFMNYSKIGGGCFWATPHGAGGLAGSNLGLLACFACTPPLVAFIFIPVVALYPSLSFITFFLHWGRSWVCSGLTSDSAQESLPAVLGTICPAGDKTRVSGVPPILSPWPGATLRIHWAMCSDK